MLKIRFHQRRMTRERLDRFFLTHDGLVDDRVQRRCLRMDGFDENQQDGESSDETKSEFHKRSSLVSQLENDVNDCSRIDWLVLSQCRLESNFLRSANGAFVEAMAKLTHEF